MGRVPTVARCSACRNRADDCSYCIDMRSRERLAVGEESRRLFALAAWREAPFVSKRECRGRSNQPARLVVAIATINVGKQLGIALRERPARVPPPADGTRRSAVSTNGL